jgi:hypothetical protein
MSKDSFEGMNQIWKQASLMACHVNVSQCIS